MSIDASSLGISLEEKENWRRNMEVTVPASIVREEEARAADKLAARARLKGFRKGRVPRKVIESRFGGSLRKEALDSLVNEAYQKALDLKQLRPISEGEIQNIEYAEEEDLVFSITFDIQPEIEINRLGGFTVERPLTEVTDDHVDKVLQRIREQNGAWRPLEEGSPVDGNLVSVKIRRLEGNESEDQGREYEFVLGRGDALPDIEEAIKSLELGGNGEFEISFPNDFPDEERRGDKEHIELTFLGLKELELPELGDDLAKQAGEFDTLDDLRVGVLEDLKKEAGNQAEAAVRSRLLDLLVQANPFDIPISMVDRYIEGVVGDEQNLEPEKLKDVHDSIRPEAEKAVKRILILDRIAETQSLIATNEEIDTRISEISEINNSTPEKIYVSLQKSGQLDSLKRELTEKKIFEFLEEQSEVTDDTTA